MAGLQRIRGSSHAAAEAGKRTAAWGNRSRDSPCENRGSSLLRVAYEGILYKDESMRSLMVVLACTAGLSAQVTESDASAKLKLFQQNLANPLKFRPGAVLSKTLHPLAMAPVKVCAIPLLRVRPDLT